MVRCPQANPEKRPHLLYVFRLRAVLFAALCFTKAKRRLFASIAGGAHVGLRSLWKGFLS